MIHVNSAGFCDDQLPILSTIGRGPMGPQGPKGDKGDASIPKFSDPIEGDRMRSYKFSTIVLHNGDSFASLRDVPAGIDIHNTDYWVQTGNYNAQIQECRDAVVELEENVGLQIDGINNEIDEINAREPFYKIDNLVNCGLIANPEMPFGTTDEYPEDFTYNPVAKTYYIATSKGNILKYDSNFQMITSNNVISNPIASLNYNPATQELYACTGTALYVIYANNLQIKETRNTDLRICYDIELEKIIGFSVNNGTLHIVEYNNSFNVIAENTFTIDNNIAITQGACAHAGCIYTANFNFITQIDYINGYTNQLKLIGSFEGALEVEGFCFTDNVEILAKTWSYGIITENKNVYIYKNEYASQTNMNTEYEKNTRLLLRGGTQIPENSDLNDFKTVGNFTTGSVAIGRTIQNSPVYDAFYLTVRLRLGVGQYGLQILTPFETPEDVYVRRFSNTTFGPWIQITTDTSTVLRGLGVTLSAGETKNFTMPNSQAIIICVRSGSNYIYGLDYWNSETHTLVAIGTPRISVSKDASSYNFSVENLMDGQSPISIIF